MESDGRQMALGRGKYSIPDSFHELDLRKGGKFVCSFQHHIIIVEVLCPLVYTCKISVGGGKRLFTPNGNELDGASHERKDAP